MISLQRQSRDVPVHTPIQKLFQVDLSKKRNYVINLSQKLIDNILHHKSVKANRYRTNQTLYITGDLARLSCSSIMQFIVRQSSRVAATSRCLQTCVLSFDDNKLIWGIVGNIPSFSEMTNSYKPYQVKAKMMLHLFVKR